MPKEKNIADRIRAARGKGGLSQSQASKSWGIALKTLQSWEQQASTPRGLYLEKVEQILKEAGE